MDKPILMIEDEPAFSELVSRYFGRRGFEVQVAASGGAGLDALEAHEPQAVLLDLRLPDMDGLEVCRQIRRQSNVPIIILSSKADETNKVAGLEMGADDYATKPFSPRELLARLRAVLRRSGEQSVTPRVTEIGPYTIDALRREVRLGGYEVALTPIEFELLWYMVRNAGQARSRDEIFTDVWGEQRGRSRTVDAHISSLRTKLPEVRIATVRGVGYRLDD